MHHWTSDSDLLNLFGVRICETLDQPIKFANLNSKVNPPHVVNKHQNTLSREMLFHQQYVTLFMHVLHELLMYRISAGAEAWLN
jgi:hypothetical protein